MTSKILFKIAAIVCVFACWSAQAADPMKQAGPAEVKKTTGGLYKIYQLENEVGQESYTRIVYSNNRVRFESEYRFSISGVDTMVDRMSILLEEDSYFPLNYHSSMKLGKTEGETSLELYANVAVVNMKRGNKETHRKKIITAGAVVSQMKYAHQLDIILQRYDGVAGGKQMLHVFDPVGGSEKMINIELVGPKETNIGTENVTLDRYDILGDRGEIWVFYVDSSKNIVKAVDNIRKLDFVLIDSWDKEG